MQEKRLETGFAQGHHLRKRLRKNLSLAIANVKNTKICVPGMIFKLLEVVEGFISRTKGTQGRLRVSEQTTKTAIGGRQPQSRPDAAVNWD
jgi:vancomycin resistance protein YoaR